MMSFLIHIYFVSIRTNVPYNEVSQCKIDHDNFPEIATFLSDDETVLLYLRQCVFKEISALHHRIYVVPNEWYLCYLVWEILRPVTHLSASFI